MKILVLALTLIVVGYMANAQEVELLEANSSGIYIGTFNERYGLYDKTKKAILEPKFDFIEDGGGGYFIVVLEKKYGLYDEKGNEILKPVYENVSIEDNRKPLVRVKDKGVDHFFIHKKMSGPLYSVATGNVFYNVSQTEVSVAEYLAYLMTITESIPAAYKDSKALPDTSHMAYNNRLVFRQLLRKMSEEEENDQKKYWGWYKVKYNFSGKILLPKSLLNDKKLVGYLDLPITGVSFAQANDFLTWYNGYISEYTSYDYLYKLRLPTPDEWSEFANSGLRAVDKNDFILDSLNDKKCMLYNTIPDKSVCSNYQEKEKRFGDNISIVLGYNPDMNGLYNVFGNVAEMTSEKGVAKGGSFRHFANHSRTNVQQAYNGPQEWLGFRWVVEFIPQ